MSRTINSSTLAAIQKDNVPLVIFVEMDFPSEFLRVTNAPYNIDWNGYTWLGVGQLGSVNQIVETGDLAAHSLSFTISGVPPTNIQKALGQDYQGRSCKLWFAVLDSDYRIVGTPIGSFNYRMDTMDINLGKTASITITAESRLIDWERANNSRYTDEEQKRLYPNDTSLEYISELAQKRILLGFV